MASPSSNLDSILITVDDEASVDVSVSTTEEFGSDIFFEDQENNHLDTSSGDGGTASASSSAKSTTSGSGHGVQERSWVWSHFQRPEKDATSALCQLCNKHVCFTKARSTGMLERHVKRKHKEVFNEALKSGQKKFRDIDSADVSLAKKSKKEFLIPNPTYEKCLLNCVILTYQPLRIVEEPSFREFCFSLNKSSHILSRDKLGTLLKAKYVMVQDEMKKLMQKRIFCCYC
jgi:hypothetical protein